MVTEVAMTLVHLRMQPVDPSWNENVRQTVGTMYPIMKEKVIARVVATPDEEADVAIKAVKGYGQERFCRMHATNCRDLVENREVLCHNDCHQFNILVKRRREPAVAYAMQQCDSSCSKDNKDNGEFIICDWEMSMMGPVGRDAGLFQAWPIACAMAHAVKGRQDLALRLLQCNIEFFNTYAQILIEKEKKTDAHLQRIFREGLGAAGTHLFYVFYMLDTIFHYTIYVKRMLCGPRLPWVCGFQVFNYCLWRGRRSRQAWPWRNAQLVQESHHVTYRGVGVVFCAWKEQQSNTLHVFSEGHRRTSQRRCQLLDRVGEPSPFFVVLVRGCKFNVLSC